MQKRGILYLLPTPLGSEDLSEVIPEGVLRIIPNLRYFFVEELRSGRRFLSAAGHRGQIESLNLFELNEHSKEIELDDYIKILEEGNDAGLLSEAGIPAVADPGASLVALAHNRGIRVVPMSGPSSIILALAGSGMNGQNFQFHGYLPVKTEERRGSIKRVEALSKSTGASQIFIETPYRNNSILSDILDICSPGTKLCIAANITLEDSFVVTKSVAEWRRERPDLNKKPCVFIL
ncbi:MAG: SAM-dependent methyltransferase [Bacteroidales bacterium]|jgi:16S rRNA (cytidine1402-2'-O)-methyltransferase|nr:SAM-dependent methyltransferase [Bacteroidales bacterium]